MGKKIKVVGELSFIQGQIKNGHLECEIDLETWNKLSLESQKEYLKHYGKVVVDDYNLQDYEGIKEVYISEHIEDEKINELWSNS